MLSPLRLEVEGLAENSPALVDIALVKQHARIDFSDDDSLLERYIMASIHWIEADTHRTLFRRQHQWVLRDFELCWPHAITLPRGKTRSVASIAYSAGGQTITLTGPSSTVPGTGYQEDLRGDSGGVLMPPRGSSWPSVDCDVPAPVVITFDAGYDADTVPPELLHALWFCIADCYEMRGEADFNPATAGKRLATREALISAYRLSRWY